MSTSSKTVNRLPHVRDLTPSAFVRACAELLARDSRGKPILDVACGSGRNGFYLASFGCDIIFADRDLTRLHDRGRVTSLEIDFARDAWPFARCTLGGIVNVHFLLPKLFSRFAASLAPGAYLLLETVPGCGHNYRELPKTGSLRRELTRDFEFEEYRERRVGPPDIGAVSVRLLARRRPG